MIKKRLEITDLSPKSAKNLVDITIALLYNDV
jgi:hypothetical protein